MKKTPKVSIITITYNHAEYIRQALDSFVMQVTDYDFEVIVADDASTDGTQEVIEEYNKKYPHIIRPILRKKNIGAWTNFIDAIREAKGDYIALCEGDDYWTDENKLQIQSELLDKNPDLGLCFHPVNVIYQDNSKKSFIYPVISESINFTVEELLARNYIQTNSVMYRRQDYSKLAKVMMPGDWYLHLFHAYYGGIGFTDRVMSVYRKHPGGMWWDSENDLSKLWSKHGTSHMAFWDEVMRLHGNNLTNQKTINNGIINLFDAMVEADKSQDNSNLIDIIAAYPRFTKVYIENLVKAKIDFKKHAKEQADIIEHYVTKYKQQEKQIAEFNKMVNSSLFKKALLYAKKLPKHIKK